MRHDLRRLLLREDLTMGPVASILAGGAMIWFLTEWLPRKRILKKWSSREDLSIDMLFARFFKNRAERESVEDALHFLQAHLDIPIGLLRPEDKLAELNFGGVEGNVDYLYDATSSFFFELPIERVRLELGGVETVRDFIAAFFALQRGAANP